MQSRNRITRAFLAALADDCDAHGQNAIEACRVNRPAQYLVIIASLLAKQLEVAQEKPVREMTREELQAEIACAKERMLAQEQFEKDWCAAQAAQTATQG